MTAEHKAPQIDPIQDQHFNQPACLLHSQHNSLLQYLDYQLLATLSVTTATAKARTASTRLHLVDPDSHIIPNQSQPDHPCESGVSPGPVNHRHTERQQLSPWAILQDVLIVRPRELESPPLLVRHRCTRSDLPFHHRTTEPPHPPNGPRQGSQPDELNPSFDLDRIAFARKP